MKTASQQVTALLDFIDASPSPWHAVQTIEKQLVAHHFVPLDETARWDLKKNGRYYVIREDSSLIAFITGQKPLVNTGYKIIAAHTDSPGLRLKPQAPHHEGGLLRLGVEIYGSPILATFSDRDLSLAGRITYKTDYNEIKTQLIHFKRALLRLPNLAIHMNPNVNQEGLKFDYQNELPLLLACADEQLPQPRFYQLLAQATGLQPHQILAWDFNVYDTQKGRFWGIKQEFYAQSQLDNLASCHAGLVALLNKKNHRTETTLVCSFFDHEEIGSESAKGAAGCFLSDVLERIAMRRENYQRALAHSFLISADMAHAYQPNFPQAYEPSHHLKMNQGIAIKINANQRYSGDSVSVAMFIQWCQHANVPYQLYSHRTDLRCGSTIGPMTSAKLGLRSIDIGTPLWAMHSLRESAGVYDHTHLIKILHYFLAQA